MGASEGTENHQIFTAFLTKGSSFRACLTKRVQVHPPLPGRDHTQRRGWALPPGAEQEHPEFPGSRPAHIDTDTHREAVPGLESHSTSLGSRFASHQNIKLKGKRETAVGGHANSGKEGC